MDYKEFSETGSKQKERNKESNLEEEDEVDLGLDLTGERELCGSIQGEELEYSELEEELDEEELELEDGEMSGQESEDPEVEECIAKQDLVRLRRILKRREEECKKLQKEVNYEKEKVQKDKEMKELLGKITKVSRTRDSLRRSLVNSRATSPVPTKEVKGKKKSETKKDKKEKKTSTKRTREENPTKEENTEKSEYRAVFDSSMNLRQGANYDFSDLVNNALEATDSIMEM